MAGDIQSAIDKAVQQQATQAETPHAPSGTYRLVGGALLVAGAIAASYGFLHTTSFEQWQPSNVVLGSVGLGAVIAGGLVLLNGQQAGRSPSVAIGRRGLAVSKRVSW
jgi:hypothetical protein